MQSLLWLGGALTLAGALWLLANRDPERRVIHSDGFLSPADGIVAAVHTVDGDSQHLAKGRREILTFLDDLPGARTIIVIMMKPWHVHTQRAPTTGTIQSLTHRHGSLRNAVFGDWRRSTVENEHLAMRLSGERPCKVYLIAGLLARRIRPLVKRREHVVQGQRIGRIILGSQVALVLPEAEVLVSVGDRVKAGVTEVAR